MHVPYCCPTHIISHVEIRVYFATPLCCPLPMVVGSSNHIPTTPSSLRTVRAWRAAQSHQSERLRLYTSIGPPTLGFALSPLRDLPP
jgi:hypothetical protein